MRTMIYRGWGLLRLMAWSGMVLASCPALAVIPPSYRVFNLSSTNARNIPFGINNFGEITGESVSSTTQQSLFRWRNGELTTMQIPDVSSCFAFGINDSGLAVASLQYSDGWRSYLWHPQNGLIDMSTTELRVDPCGINNHHEVIGVATAIEDGRELGFRWNSFNGLSFLPTLADTFQAKPTSINDSGIIAGECIGQDNRFIATVWQNTSMEEIDPVALDSYAGDINNNGSVLGYRSGPLMPSGYFLRKVDGAIVDIDFRGDSIALNDLEQVVGNRLSSNGYYSHAVIWENGTTHDLNDLIPTDSGWMLTDASDINDHGWIVGVGEYQGQQSGYLLIPSTDPIFIPEPTTLGLLTLGSLLALRRRR